MYSSWFVVGVSIVEILKGGAAKSAQGQQVSAAWAVTDVLSEAMGLLLVVDEGRDMPQPIPE
jgi:hypothetical protein